MSNFGTERMRIAWLVLGLLGTGCAPFLVFPGGELRGTLDSSVKKYGDDAESWGFWRGEPEGPRASEAFVYRLDPR